MVPPVVGIPLLAKSRMRRDLHTGDASQWEINIYVYTVYCRRESGGDNYKKWQSGGRLVVNQTLGMQTKPVSRVRRRPLVKRDTRHTWWS